MVLDRDDGKFSVTKPFNSTVVQVDVAYLQSVLQSVSINCVAMVLSSDMHPAGFQISHGVIATAMSKFELEGSPSESLAQDLLSQAYAHDRLHSYQPSHCVYYVFEQRWISRAR